MKIKIESKELEVDQLLCIGRTDKESDKCFVTVAPGTTIADAFQLLHTLSLQLLNNYTVAANEGQLPANPTKEQLAKFVSIKQQLYSMYNEAVSSVLQLYAPEFELRPDVTTEAIMRAEEEVVNERYNKMNREQRRAAHQEFTRHVKKIQKDKAKFDKKLEAENKIKLDLSDVNIDVKVD